MRLEATIPDSRASAVQALAEELGLSRSQIIDEALSLFVKAVLEVRRGRRLVTVDPNNAQSTCELVTPTLAALEWTLHPERLELAEPELAKVREVMTKPPRPGRALRAAARRHRR
jgi:hypothetical protein